MYVVNTTKKEKGKGIIMNINELNRIKTVNVEEKVAEVVAGSGTFKEILDKVMANEILPIVSNSGNIVGISYDSKVSNLIDDNIAQVAFEKRYQGIDVMSYVLTALKLKADNAQIAEVQEDEEGIRVILNNGEVVVVRSYAQASEDRPAKVVEELPSEVEITYDEADSHSIEEGPEEDKMTLKYLRDKYNHYLSGAHPAPTIEYDDEARLIKVSNIHWGRKK